MVRKVFGGPVPPVWCFSAGLEIGQKMGTNPSMVKLTLGFVEVWVVCVWDISPISERTAKTSWRGSLADATGYETFLTRYGRERCCSFICSTERTRRPRSASWASSCWIASSRSCLWP